MVDWLWRSQMHHCAKFYQNQLNGCGGMVFVWFFQNGGCPLSWICNYGNFKSRSFGCRGPRCITMPNFVKIGHMVAEIWRFFDFSRWRSSAILDLWGAFWDHPLTVLGGLYYLTKFGWNPFSSFCNMKIWIFCVFGWEMPIHTPKLVFLGDLTP